MTESSRPFDRAGLVRRVLPFAGIALLAFPAAALPVRDPVHELLAWAAALSAVVVAAALFVPWTRLPRWTDVLPPLLYIGAVALLRESSGGPASGYASLAVVPVVWVALYGTRRDVALICAAVTAMFFAPVIAGQYPAEELRRALMWTLTAPFVGFTVHGLVRRMRTAQHDLRAAVADGRRIQSELRDAEAHFRRAFEDAPIGMALVALDGRFLDVNASLSAMSGFSREELLATSLTELTHPGDRDEVTAQLRAMLDGDVAPVVADGRLTHNSGGELSVSVHATLLRDAGGRPDHVLVQIHDTTEQRAFEEQLTFLADHDHLTSLYNRRRFEQEVDRHLAHCRRYGPSGALALIDIDEFKQVNDTFGHAVGDGLIVKIAEILERRLRESDVVARLGGDEFAVLLPTVDREEAEAAMGAVLDQIRQEARAGDDASRRPVTVSVGLTMFPDTRGSSLDAVLAAADVALYEAKQAGRDRVETFD